MLRLDIAKARHRLGWTPTWEIELALDKTVAWYRGYAKGTDLRALSLAQIDEFERASKTLEYSQ